MSKKAAIELSTNFLVVIILSIVTLSLGIVLFKGMLDNSEQLVSTIDENTQEQLRALLDTGAPVAVPMNTEEIGRGGFTQFWVGVRNELGEDSRFNITVAPASAFLADGSICRSTTATSMTRLIGTTGIPIRSNEQYYFPVGIGAKKTAPSCVYAFNVQVKQWNGTAFSIDYGTMQKLYVTVK